MKLKSAPILVSSSRPWVEMRPWTAGNQRSDVRYPRPRYEPVISFSFAKKARFRAELMPQFTGTLW